MIRHFTFSITFIYTFKLRRVWGMKGGISMLV